MGGDKKEHTSNMGKYINADNPRQYGLNLTAVDINMNWHWTCKDKQSEV